MEEVKPVLTWTLFSECEIPEDLDKILVRGEEEKKTSPPTPINRYVMPKSFHCLA